MTDIHILLHFDRNYAKLVLIHIGIEILRGCMLELKGLHFLTTYQCTFECDHCFVWGSPWQQGTMTLDNIRFFLRQAKDTPNIQAIYFEGGEPFLYYATVLQAVQLAADMGFHVGLVSNAYWAISLEDAVAWLKPFSGLLQDLSVSSDLYHYNNQTIIQVKYAEEAARMLDIPVGSISIAAPEALNSIASQGQLSQGESRVMFRGRAANKLSSRAVQKPWHSFVTCPDEDLRTPGRVHLDPFGNIHICQGIVIGNLFVRELVDICTEYDPDNHPVIGPLLRGGPAELARTHQANPQECYADACHLCYATRMGLRGQFPEILQPGNMYGVFTQGCYSRIHPLSELTQLRGQNRFHMQV